VAKKQGTKIMADVIFTFTKAGKHTYVQKVWVYLCKFLATDGAAMLMLMFQGLTMLLQTD